MNDTAHTGSWYAATASRQTDFAPLTGQQRADVCIVGAGFTGLSAALELAERGYDVKVVEARKVGWGASGRNGGQLIAGIAGEEKLQKALGKDGARRVWELRWAGHDIVRRRCETYGIDCDLRFGYADVALKPRHLRKLQGEYDYLQRHGLGSDAQLLTATETGEAFGTDVYSGALLNRRNGHLHPLNFCIGEADAAVALGASIYEHSPVLGIDKGKRPAVVTADGSISAEQVIIAGNAYHRVAPGLRDSMLPVSSFILATEPLVDAPEINPGDLAVCNPNFVIEYFRMSRDRRLLFGGRCNYTGDDPAVIEQQLRPRMLKVYPQLKAAKIDFAWGGRMGFPFNRVPQLGRLARGVYYAQGYCGHGVNVSQLAGKILADAACGESEGLDMFARVKTWKIPAARYVEDPMVRLAILYYRLRDWL